MPVELPAGVQVAAAVNAAVTSLTVAAGEPGIDTATAGVLEIGGDNATTVEIGKGNVVVDASGNVAARSFTASSSSPYAASDDAYAAGTFGGKVASGASQRFQNYRPQSTSIVNGATPGGSGLQHAPFGLEIDDSNQFIDTKDPVMYFGYNMGPTGTTKFAGEPYCGFVVEGDFNDGTAHKVETYLEYYNMDRSITFRPFFFQMDRSITGAGNINAALAGSFIRGNPFTVTTADGTIIADFHGVAAPLAGQTRLYQSTAMNSDTRFTINAATGHAPHIELRQNDVAIVTFDVLTATSGAIGVNGLPVLNLFSRNATGGAVSINVNDNQAALTVVGGTPQAGFTTLTSLVARAGTTQSADLQQWQDKNAAVLARVTNVGKLTTFVSASANAGFNLPHGAAPSAPADGDMWSTTAGLFIRVNGTTKTVTLT